MNNALCYKCGKDTNQNNRKQVFDKQSNSKGWKILCLDCYVEYMEVKEEIKSLESRIRKRANKFWNLNG